VEKVLNNWVKVPDITFWPTLAPRALAQYHS
jgi:hypothetical protein